MSQDDGKGRVLGSNGLRAGAARRGAAWRGVCVRTVWLRDALSNVLFISRENKACLFILRTSRCVRNAAPLPRATTGCTYASSKSSCIERVSAPRTYAFMRPRIVPSTGNESRETLLLPFLNHLGSKAWRFCALRCLKHLS